MPEYIPKDGFYGEIRDFNRLLKEEMEAYANTGYEEDIRSTLKKFIFCLIGKVGASATGFFGGKILADYSFLRVGPDVSLILPLLSSSIRVSITLTMRIKHGEEAHFAEGYVTLEPWVFSFANDRWSVTSPVNMETYFEIKTKHDDSATLQASYASYMGSSYVGDTEEPATD
jgi:hypothetical protein